MIAYQVLGESPFDVVIAPGRWSWAMFAQDLGIPADAITPLPLVLLMVPAVILITNTVAFWPARTAARLKPKAMKLWVG